MNHRFLRGVLRDETVEGGGGGAHAVADEPVLDAKALKVELEAAKAALAEQQQAAQYWHGETKKLTETARVEPKPVAAAAATEDDEDPLEMISKKGAKGLDELLKKRGLITRQEAEEISNTRVSQATQQLTEEAALLKNYPELSNKESKFFKSTAVAYQALVDSGVPQTRAMRLAAEQVELAQLKSGERLTEDEKAERAARAAAQSGDRNKGKSNTAATAAGDGGDDELTPLQKQICEEMEISQEAYKKRAKEGVAFYTR